MLNFVNRSITALAELFLNTVSLLWQLLAQVVIPSELDQPTRKRLLGLPYGQTATVRDWCLKVVELTLGNPQKKIAGKTMEEIGLELGISRQWVSNYIELAIKYNLADVDPNNPKKIKVHEKTQQEIFQEYSEQYPILKDQLVIEWDRNMAFRKNGKPIVARTQHIRSLQRFCNFHRVKPVQLIQDRNTTGTLLETYLEKLRDGTIKRQIRSNTKNSPEQAFGSIKSAVRHFCSYHGISLPKGLGGIWDARVLGHGQYADVRLSDQQFEMLDKILLEQYGLDSNIYRLVWTGIESGSRAKALMTMKLDWTESTDDGLTTFYMTAYESKTKHIKEGKWTKYITRPHLQESLKLLKARGTTDYLYENISETEMYNNLRTELKKIYKAIGLTNPYFYEHPTHSLRHISAQHWLVKTNYDYALVCIICGWHTEAELKASYGEMPPSVIAAKVKAAVSSMHGVAA